MPQSKRLIRPLRPVVHLVALAVAIAGPAVLDARSAFAQSGARVIATVPVGRAPLGVGVDSGLRRVFVTNSQDDSVSMLDGTGDTVLDTIPVGRRPFFHVAVDEVGHRVFVTNNGDGTLAIIDAVSGGLADTVAGLDGAPEGVGVHPGRKRAYVTRGGHTLSVIDLERRRVLSDIDTGAFNHTVAIDAALERAYVSRSAPDVLTVIDLATESWLADLPATGHPAIDLRTHRVYLADFRAPRVWVVDGIAGRVVGSIPLAYRPLLLAIDAARGCLYTTHPADNRVTVVDMVGGRVLGTLLVGAEPAGIAADTSSGKVYVANTQGNSVTVIQGEACSDAVLPSPTRTPTASPSPSATPTPTSSPSPSATASPSSTAVEPPMASPTAATATSSPPTAARLFLPVLNRESCPPPDLFIDVVLVMDASLSMLDSGPAGKTKLADAKEAARRFISPLRLTTSPDTAGDRVAIVTFNTRAQLVEPLGSSAAVLRIAIEGIAAASGSRVDLGIRRAADVLSGTSRKGRIPAMVILSDGRVDAAAAVAASRDARALGIELYVVGLGPQHDAATLAAMALSPDRYFNAPDSGSLARIYTDLTTLLPCPPAAFWGGR